VKHAVDKAEQYAYRDRRVKKRNFRALWIMRINAAARQNGTSYSRLMDALHKKNIDINRKALAEIAVKDPAAFTHIVRTALD
jgi:large subunit ribosomal protein L20